MAMAVRAQQRFLDDAPLLINNAGNSASAWMDNRGGERAVDLCCFPQQKQQQPPPTGMMVARAASVHQQRAAPGTHCLPPPAGSLPAEVSYAMAVQMDNQKREMDQFISLQMERLRAALQHQMKGHLVALMRRLESKTSALMRQKEADLAGAYKKAADLEAYLKQAEAEGQTWQTIARENEAVALSLRNALDQVRDNAGVPIAGGAVAGAGAADDAVSCCDSSCGPAGPDIAAQRGGGEGQGVVAAAAAAGRCRGCGARGSCMLFMPCMHLCACKLCDSVLDSCPVCRCLKHDSMEALF